MKPLFFLRNALFLFLAASIFLLLACKNKQQSDASEVAGQIQNALKENTPGFIKTSADGYMMKAKIDGKEWAASAMLPNDNSSSRRIQGENNGEAIGFYIWTRGLEAGKHIAFGESKAADLFTNDDIGIWGGRKGEIVITKIDSVALEGTFAFTASTTRSAKTVDVTEGYFRIPLVAAP